MKRHNLKCWPEPFNEVTTGIKTFEYRLNDRDYKNHDILILNEWDPVKKWYTGKTITVKVTSIMYGGVFGIPKEYCIMSTTKVGI